jgi:hypothetical protein
VSGWAVKLPTALQADPALEHGSQRWAKLRSFGGVSGIWLVREGSDLP